MYPKWTVKEPGHQWGMSFNDVQHARVVAQRHYEQDNREKVIMQQDDDMSPPFVLEYYPKRGIKV